MVDETSKIDIKALREHYNLSRSEFCRFFNIPYRTVQDWEIGKRKMPDYVYELLEYKLYNEFEKIKEKSDA